MHYNLKQPCKELFRYRCTTSEIFNMQLKTAISQNESLNRIINLMQFHTPMGRMALLQKEMMTDGTQIDESRRQLDNMEKHLLTKQSTALMEHLLIEVRDIHTTLFNLSNGQRMDEIALFEIKAFASQVMLYVCNDRSCSPPLG